MTDNPSMQDRYRLDMLNCIRNKENRDYCSKSGKILVDIVNNIYGYTYTCRPYTLYIYLLIEILAESRLSNFLHRVNKNFLPCSNNSLEDIR